MIFTFVSISNRATLHNAVTLLEMLTNVKIINR